MNTRFGKRFKILGGLGLNVGKKGASVSLRTKMGSIGTKGVSVRTGVSGLTIQHRYKKSQPKVVDIKPTKTEVINKPGLIEKILFIIIAPFVVVYEGIKFIFWSLPKRLIK